jgi:Zn-dependent protease
MFQQSAPYQFLLMIVPLLFAVTIHEVAHGFAALKMGDPTAHNAGRLTLNPLKHLDPVGSLLLPGILALTGSPIIFGYAKPVPVNFFNLSDYRIGTIVVGAAGVTANFICAAVSGLAFQGLMLMDGLWTGGASGSIVFGLAQVLAYSVVINAVLMIFNLIPIPPLDGSRILAMVLPEDLREQYMRIESFGLIIIIFLLMTGVLDKIFTFFIHPFVNFFLGK